LYFYGQEGRQSSWDGTTYEYRATKGGMVVDVISPNNQVIFARLTLRSLPHGRLSGKLVELRSPARSQQLTFVPVP
jgi:hypothetical protein